MKTISYMEYRNRFFTPVIWVLMILGFVAAVTPIVLAFAGYFGKIPLENIFLYFGFLAVMGVLIQISTLYYYGFIKQVYYYPEKPYLTAPRYNVYEGEAAKQMVKKHLVWSVVWGIIFIVTTVILEFYAFSAAK